MPQPNGKNSISEWHAALTPEQRSELGRRGGVASGKARRRHRELRLILRELLAAPLTDDEQVSEALTGLGLEATQEAALMLAAVRKGKKGDTDALRFIRDTLGEKPTDAVELAVQSKPVRALDLSGLSDSELEALADRSEGGGEDGAREARDGKRAGQRSSR